MASVQLLLRSEEERGDLGKIVRLNSFVQVQWFCSLRTNFNKPNSSLNGPNLFRQMFLTPINSIMNITPINLRFLSQLIDQLVLKNKGSMGKRWLVTCVTSLTKSRRGKSSINEFVYLLVPPCTSYFAFSACSKVQPHRPRTDMAIIWS